MGAPVDSETHRPRLHVVSSSFLPSRVHLTKSQVQRLHVRAAAQSTKRSSFVSYVQRGTIRTDVSKTPGDSGMSKNIL